MSRQSPTVDRGSANIPHWYAPGSEPPTITDGDGSYVYDDEGNEYLDFLSQLYCVNAGHSNETITDRMAQQLDRVQYVSSSKHNDARSELAGRIADVAPENLTDVFFSVSGSEANEAAVQLARDYMDAPKVLTRWQSYHGTTYGAGALTGDPETRATVERHAAVTGHGKFLPPLSENGAFEADSDAELARKAADHLEFVLTNEDPDEVAAVLMEPVGGTSGAYPAPADYFERVREICDRHDVLLIADEVITGFGRCGEWFGIQTESVQPDLITFAKGCTSAYAPLAGVVTGPEMAAHFREEGIEVGQTFSGHPVACAAGLGAMDAYEDGLIENVREHAPYLGARLRELADEHEVVAEARGRGYHWAVTFADPETGDPFVHPWTEKDGDNPVPAVRREAQDRGVLFGRGRPDTQVVISPPFTAGRGEIDTAVDALSASIDAAFEGY
jgi:taurine--2-oxoglutarate transaminase